MPYNKMLKFGSVVLTFYVAGVLTLQLYGGGIVQMQLLQRTPGRGSGVPSANAKQGQVNEFICFQGHAGRRRATIGTATSPVPFSVRSTLEVQVSSPDRELVPQIYQAVAEHVAKAMVLWKRSCPKCVAGNIAILLINGRVYMDSYLASYMRSADLNDVRSGPDAAMTSAGSITGELKPTAPAAQTSFPFDLVLAILDSRLNARVPIIQYEAISPSDILFTKLCSARLDGLPALLHDVRLAVLCPGDDSLRAETAHLALYILNGFTSCGRNQNIVGCSADDLVVELNARDYAFVSHESGQRLFGSGTITVDLLHVILHEFGHWLGLPHLYSPGNLMADSLEESRCIDDTDVNQLSVYLSDLGGRRRGKGAFFYRKPAR